MLDAKEMRQRLLQAGLAHPDQLRGCSQDEVESVERNSGLELPSAYKDFLQAFGHSAGGFWQDAEFTADRLAWINREAREILSELESVSLPLPYRGFVFSSRHGEQFLFFIADGEDQNPPVYHYCIGLSEFRKASDTFWDAIEAELAELEQVRKNLPPGLFPWVK